MVEADPFIRFHCNNCGYKSTVSESYAGKNIRCPKCYNTVFIPTVESTGAVTSQSSPGKPKTPSKYSDYDLTLLDTEEQNIIQDQQIREYAALEQAAELEQEPDAEEPIDERRLPWFIDIFLYLFSIQGLKNLAIFIGLPLLLDILGTFLPIQLSCLFALVCLVVNILLLFFIYWYFTECVRDSADGGVRAPEGLGATPGVAVMFWQTVNVIGCLAVFFGPFVFYMLFAKRADIIFWLLLSYAVFLFPMGLLAVVMFNSAIGLNPRLLIRSISGTFFPYCGLVLLFATPVVLIGIIQPETQESLFWKFILRSVIIYMVLIGAHLLGRFYWRYQEKLNWVSKPNCKSR
ncbi:MAG: hypothetical protein WAV28_03110 [Sedimentisphaerales bacterium]